MVHAKFYGLTAAFVALLMLFAVGAAATTLTSPKGTIYTGRLYVKSEGYALKFVYKSIIEGNCKVETEGQVQQHGASVTAAGPYLYLRVMECTSNANVGWVVHVKKTGSFGIHGLGSGNGTLTWTGGEIEATISSFIWGNISCIYATNETDVGTITGSTTTGGKAKIDYSGTIPRISGSTTCPSTAVMTGTVEISTPFLLEVD